MNEMEVERGCITLIRDDERRDTKGENSKEGTETKKERQAEERRKREKRKKRKCNYLLCCPLSLPSLSGTLSLHSIPSAASLCLSISAQFGMCVSL